jgi:flagellar motor protein MotB
MRLSASGKGRNDPVADNDSAAGRQQNRRVEVTISNPPAALR